jgi:hypothetical protein
MGAKTIVWIVVSICFAAIIGLLWYIAKAFREGTVLYFGKSTLEVVKLRENPGAFCSAIMNYVYLLLIALVLMLESYVNWLR